MLNRKLVLPWTLLAIGMPLILFSACTARSQSLSKPSYWPTEDWHNSTPEEQGFDSVQLAEALQAMRDNNINIHSLMIIRNDDVILDAYFYPYNGETVHELASVTKSVMTTLIGMAVNQDKLHLEDRMVLFFPDRSIANRGLFKNLITVRQLTGMTSGLNCIAEHDEQTLNEMGLAEDWIQFSLDLRAKYIPGTHFSYCGPGMHILSAILQASTGLKAAEFARINLFEPLGIHDVIWDVDPQGYNDGWAGLYLHPRDLAKLGYLMLYHGQWEEEQIVSNEWVEEATKLHIKTGVGDNYGYGWWVPPPTDFIEFVANGRGGQYIRVFPELNMIVVTTGNGFVWNDIVPLLAPAMVDLVEPLPANPAGIEQLNDTLTTIIEPPTPQTVPPLPETARAISGQTYVFDSNPLNLHTLGLEFDETAEARLWVTFTNQPDQDLVVGLDGVYRLFPVGKYDLDVGLRGHWTDAQTFTVEYDQIANQEAYSLDMRFEGEKLILNAKERTHEAVITVEGTLHNTTATAISSGLRLKHVE